MLGAIQIDYLAKGVLKAMQGPFKREITEEQYKKYVRILNVTLNNRKIEK